jgi:hypothetical protein
LCLFQRRELVLRTLGASGGVGAPFVGACETREGIPWA